MIVVKVEHNIGLAYTEVLTRIKMDKENENI